MSFFDVVKNESCSSIESRKNVDRKRRMSDRAYFRRFYSAKSDSMIEKCSRVSLLDGKVKYFRWKRLSHVTFIRFITVKIENLFARRNRWSVTMILRKRRGRDFRSINPEISLFPLSRREIWIRASSEKCIRYRRSIKRRIFSKFNLRRKSIFDDIFRFITYRFDDVRNVEYFRRF